MYREDIFNTADWYGSPCAMERVSRARKLANMVKRVQALVVNLFADRRIHYEVSSLLPKTSFYQSETGTEVIRTLKDMNKRLNESGRLEACQLNPFFALFHASYLTDKDGLDSACYFPNKMRPAMRVQVLNCFVDRVRMNQRLDLELLVRKLDRGAVQRADSMLRSLNHAFGIRSRLLVSRIDLSYLEGSFVNNDLASAMERVKADWNRMYHALQGGLVEHLRAFAARVEYGILSGYHLHVLLLFDGSDRWGDIRINTIIGEYWANKVTEGEGRYWNCNRFKDDYPRSALGMVEHSDTVTRESLREVVVKYLAKPDAITAWHLPQERTFFRSIVPTRAVERKGRPRLKAL